MPRTPLAARTLISQVRSHLGRDPQSKIGLETARAVGEPDGFGVVRSVEFDPVASKWLAKVLPELGLDEPRIDGFDVNGTGKDQKVTVNFSSKPIADDRAPFALTDAEVVADSSTAQ